MTGDLSPGTLLDACCLLNLCAGHILGPVATILGAPLLVAEAVSLEALFLRRGCADEDADERDPIDIAAQVASGLLSVVPLADAELATFLAYASQVDVGEAATCALAVHRDLAVATDDRKAKRLLQAHAPGIHLYSTLELLKLWADSGKIEALALAHTLQAVRERGNFLPPKADPLRGWWHASIQIL